MRRAPRSRAPGVGDRVFAVEAAPLGRQDALAIAEHDAVLRIGERPARVDGALDRLGLGRQLRPTAPILRSRCLLACLRRRRSTAALRRRRPLPTGAVAATAAADPTKPREIPERTIGRCYRIGAETSTLCHIFGHDQEGIKYAPTHAAVSVGSVARRISADQMSVQLLTQRAALASATASAVMLMMRRTVADGVRMCTGWAAPSSTGPIAMPPPAAVFSRL